MQVKRLLVMAAGAAIWMLFAQNTFAMCYTIPHTSTYLSSYYLQGFEGESTTCPQSNGNRWIEVCAKPANMPSASYSLCGSGYGIPGQQFTSLRFNYNQAYDYRVRYQKTDGSLGVLMYGSISGVPNGGGSGGSGNPNCPPYNPNCTCPAGYPMGHPLCD